MISRTFMKSEVFSFEQMETWYMLFLLPHVSGEVLFYGYYFLLEPVWPPVPLRLCFFSQCSEPHGTSQIHNQILFSRLT